MGWIALGFLAGLAVAIVSAYLTINKPYDQLQIGFGIWFVTEGLAGFIYFMTMNSAFQSRRNLTFLQRTRHYILLDDCNHYRLLLRNPQNKVRIGGGCSGRKPRCCRRCRHQRLQSSLDLHTCRGQFARSGRELVFDNCTSPLLLQYGCWVWLASNTDCHLCWLCSFANIPIRLILFFPDWNANKNSSVRILASPPRDNTCTPVYLRSNFTDNFGSASQEKKCARSTRAPLRERIDRATIRG